MLAFKELFSGHWDDQSRWLQFASFHFDVSVLEQYWSWFVGITVVAAPRDLILSDLIGTISKLEITHIDLTPSLARLTHPDEVPSLCRGVFITGGEQLRQDVLDNWGPKEVIYNAYGPTEATIGVTMFQRVPTNGRSSNIGHLFPNVGAYVFQPGTEIPVLKGAVGELCVSGRLVGKGYLNRPDLTEECFPTLEHYGERIYRTGDLVRVLHDGSFDFLGRSDDQVKLRGQRLEIGEINHAIKSGVAQVTDVATLVARHGGHGRDLLVSFVALSRAADSPDGLCILSNEGALNIANMAQEACRGRLPGYMVPTYVFSIPFIPLSTNNKANLNSLKQLFGTLSQDQLRTLSSGTVGEGRELNNREQRIASVIATIAGIESHSIRPSSTIFELGIDSITVTRVARGLLKAGFPSAAPSVILKNPQISRLAQVLEQEKTSTIASRVLQVKQSIHALHRKYLGLICRTLNVTKADLEYVAPCTPLQEGMLTRAHTSGDHSAYFNQFCFILKPNASSAQLRAAWTRAVDSCAILRTSFVQTPDGYVQAALKRRPVPWTVSQVGDEPIQGYIDFRHQKWVDSNQEVLRHPIELDYVKGPGEHVLVLRLFHAIYDAHSFDLILRQVMDEYIEASKLRAPSFLECLPYGPLLTYNASKHFWETLFQGHLFQPMPKLASTVSTSDTTVSQVIKIDNLETRRITLGVTYQTVLQAAWLAVLQEYFTDPPAIGVVFSGRSISFEGVENVIGPMFNTLPFRVKTSSMTTWRSLVRKVHDYNTSALDFVHTPLRDIQKWCSHGRQLFDTLFAFNLEGASDIVGTNDLWSSIDSTAIADYPLALEVVLTRDGDFRATIVAQAGIADKDTLGGILQKLQRALRSLATSDNDTAIFNRREAGLSTNEPSITQENLTLGSPRRGESSAFEWTDLAQKLRREIAQLAGLDEDEISEKTSIFELGLDSIDAIKLSARLSNIGVRTSTSALMKRGTVENILSSLDTVQTRAGSWGAADAHLTASITKLKGYLVKRGVDLQDTEAVLPPTPLQDSMVTDMILSGFQRYFNHDVLEIPSEMDLNSLKAAWATVYANSPVLRTSFAEVDDPSIPTAFCQLVKRDSLQFGSMLKITGLEDIRMVIDDARRKAQQANGRSALFQVNFVATPTSRYVVISIAHALYDGWSLYLLFQDVKAAYDGHYQARNSYETYLSHLLFTFGTTSHNFWTDLMHDVHPTILQPKEDVPETQGSIVHRAERASKLNTRDIRALCKTYGVTPQVLSQGCWAVVLSTLAKSLDVTFGVVLSGRDTDDAQELLFPTMNTVAMRVILHGTVAEYLHSLQSTMSEVLEFQHISLRQVQKLAGVKGQSLFDTLFILQNQGGNQIEGQPIMRSVEGSSAVEYPICIEMELANERAIWRIACDERLGSADDASRILGDLEIVLQHFSQNRDAEVVEFEPNTDEVRICGLDSFKLEGQHQLESDAAIEASHDENSQWAGVDTPIVEVLAQISGVEKDSIKPDDSIYHLGLDSISAMKASSMLRHLGFPISVRDMLKAASIRQLVEHTLTPERQPREPSSDAGSYLQGIDVFPLFKDIGIDTHVVEKVLPVLPVQVHMLTVWQNTSGLLFFPTFTYKLVGNMSFKTVAKAWKTLVEELPILRTLFSATDNATIPFIQIVIRSDSISGPETTTAENIEHGRWSFRAAPTPFVSITIDGSDLGEAHMCVRLHHALYDGVSLPIIMDRFVALCDTDSSPLLCSSDIPEAWYKFASDHHSPEVKKEAKRFWISYLEGVSPLHVLASHLDTQSPAQQVAVLKKDVIPELGRLKRWASSHGVTLQALFFAAYAKVLGNHHRVHAESGSLDDVVFGVYMANRTSFPGVEEAPFPTLGILPLRVKSPASKRIESLTAEIQADLHAVSGFENSTAGLWEIHQWTGLKIDTFVNFLSLPESSATSGTGLSLEEVPTDAPPLKADGDDDWSSCLASPDGKWASRNKVRDCYMDAIDVEVAVRGGAMDIGVFSSSAFYSEAMAVKMVEQIACALREAE
ncbi:NRPS [Diatrype stigma]|uniref:NRPS n=1 Tax=Diatrype stigma TaxID=117547 RepID=A0AAN9UV35_9PEZI